MSDFIDAGIHHIVLKPDQDGTERWVDVKEELSSLDEKRLTGAGLTSGRQREDDPEKVEIGLDFVSHFFTKLEVWVVAWSFRDKNGVPVPVHPQTIRKLKPAVADEIEDAIDAYQEELAKNALSGTSKTSQT